MSVSADQLAEVAGAPSRAAIVGALVCAGVAVLLAGTTAFVTFGLSRSYGFGPVWDWSAFVMTGAVAALAGTALLGATRLARLRFRALHVVAVPVASVFAIGYVAGVLGNRLHG